MSETSPGQQSCDANAPAARAARPPRPCKRAGCRALSREANGFCPAHQEHAAALEAQRRKRGDEWRESAGKRGYGHNWSKRVRPGKLKKDPLCFLCGERGEIQPAIVVHHKDHNPRNNSPKNLQSLCFECHERLHGRKR